jgi:hypothetical protein
VDRSIGRGHSESRLREQLDDPKNGAISQYIYRNISLTCNECST